MTSERTDGTRRVVDIVYYDSEADAYGLGLLEKREWGSINKHEEDISRRVNDYLSFVLDGQLEKMHPDAKGKLVVINLLYAHPPDEKWLRHFDSIRKELMQYGIRFEVNKMPG